MSRVVVLVPTFRRPKSLGRLLEALASSPTNVRIIVADNDPPDAAGAELAKSIAASGVCPYPIDTLRVAERGIAQVRNALVEAAIADTDTRFIAMIDDDEYPTQNWLPELLATQRATGADVVGGPVVRDCEIEVPAYLVKANNHNRGERRTGPTPFVDATSNVLFSADVFRDAPGPWFDPFFGLTGGEDKDFMTVLKMRGKTFAWSDDACVSETLPTSRCSVGWAIQRAYSTGNSDMLINLRRRPPGFNVVSEAGKISAALVVALFKMSVLSFDEARRFEGRRLAARTAGKLAALFGRRHFEYEIIHGA